MHLTTCARCGKAMWAGPPGEPQRDCALCQLADARGADERTAPARRFVACFGCAAAIEVTPGPDMPEDGSRYRRWRCACGLEYDLGRQDGQGYIFLLPGSCDDAEEEGSP
jgi:hypothetical protein